VVSRRSLLLAGGVAATLAGCTKPAKSSKPRAVDRVTYLTALGFTGRDGYPFVADELGYFRDAGIEVDIQSGKGSAYNYQLLTGLRADFASGDSSGALVQYAKQSGATDDFAVICAIQQQTLISTMAMTGRGITSPTGLAGKTVATVAGSAPETLFPAYARITQIPAPVKLLAVDQAVLNSSLIAGKVDAALIFLVAKGSVEAAAGGRTVTVMPWSDHMPDLYGNVLVTRKKIVENNPDLARRFRDALLKGLQYAVEHPDDAGRIIAKRASGVNATAAAGELKAMKPYVLSGPAVGALDPIKFAKSAALLKSAGMLAPDTPADLAISMIAKL
jgi:NitT/TauT family transport system substrate-binding protein